MDNSVACCWYDVISCVNNGYYYACDVQFLVINNLRHRIIFGLDMLYDTEAVIDVHQHLMSLRNNLVIVPLIRRFAKANILRTACAVTIPPMHEVRLPIHINVSYSLQPSVVEPIGALRNKSMLVA